MTYPCSSYNKLWCVRVAVTICCHSRFLARLTKEKSLRSYALKLTILASYSKMAFEAFHHIHFPAYCWWDKSKWVIHLQELFLCVKLVMNEECASFYYSVNYQKVLTFSENYTFLLPVMLSKEIFTWTVLSAISLA